MSTVAPTNTNRRTAAATHNLLNLGEMRLASRGYVWRIVAPIATTARRPEIEIVFLSHPSAARNRKAKLIIITTLMESRIWIFLKKVLRAIPVAEPRRRPVITEIGICNRLIVSKLPPVERVSMEVKRMIT